MYYELADVKAQLQQANFKKENYDRVKLWVNESLRLIWILLNMNKFFCFSSERDDYEKKYNDAEAKITKKLAIIQVMTKERDDMVLDVRLNNFPLC